MISSWNSNTTSLRSLLSINCVERQRGGDGTTSIEDWEDCVSVVPLQTVSLPCIINPHLRGPFIEALRAADDYVGSGIVPLKVPIGYFVC